MKILEDKEARLLKTSLEKMLPKLNADLAVEIKKLAAAVAQIPKPLAPKDHTPVIIGGVSEVLKELSSISRQLANLETKETPSRRWTFTVHRNDKNDITHIEAKEK